jgi:hypothetical protein
MLGLLMRVRFDVFGCSQQQDRVVKKLSDSLITVCAQESAHPVAFVAMID